ncbi:hypothetical protein R9C00_15220 [Flammeovirgaceae bacterium SG7u.111]|nr:hypothetical protein [Flammeovirgaceae bacterium SG7u.132]WPO33052.1 hypothetical protein R9C00_15220 [Flammeovirgaceae bacterium SG7u.111]
MPANSKYLTRSKWQRFAKISAGFVGGFLVSASLHIAIAAWFDRTNVIITASFTFFLTWSGLMVLSFLARNGWKLWALYIGVSLLFIAIVLLKNSLM